MTNQSRIHGERESERLRLELAMESAKNTARCTAGGVVAVKDKSERGPSAALLDLPALRRLRDQIDFAIACAENGEPVPITLRGSELLSQDEIKTVPRNEPPVFE